MTAASFEYKLRAWIVRGLPLWSNVTALLYMLPPMFIKSVQPTCSPETRFYRYLTADGRLDKTVKVSLMKD